jgi:hypothetical protein
MAPMLRSQLGASVLPATAPTAAELALGKQPGSTQQLAVYAVLANSDVSSSERIEFKFAGGITQNYPQADYQYMTDVNGDEYFYGTVCIKMSELRKTGSFPDWVYAMNRPPDNQLPTGYTV